MIFLTSKQNLLLMKQLLFFFMLVISSNLAAQPDFYSTYKFSEADTLRGMLRPERTCFDVTFYDIDLKLDIDQQFISGTVDIRYNVVENFTTLQLDLYQNMKIKTIRFLEETLNFQRQHNAVFVNFPTIQKKGSTGTIQVQYEGKPTVAVRAPWDGGFVWSEDSAGNPWVGVACEGDGASLWWPCKDHLSDEPDSVSIRLTVPSELIAVANGNLMSKEAMDKDYTRYNWLVSYPINTYNVTLNVANYVHLNEIYTALDGTTTNLDYYVLAENEEKAKKHFQQTPKVITCFERYFGKYPFWEDGIAFVETPYLGMEHQGAIAYGNQYMRGYLGGMIPSDMNWDYIIVHEYGHEYFGNSVSAKDIAELWIHESFTTYMEALYVECAYSYKDAVRYLNGQKPYITNQEPIVGPLNVNFEEWRGSDQYYKGAWMLHSLRHAINDDEVWFDLLRSLHNKFAYATITTKDVIDFVNTCTKRNFTPFFEQYLYYTDLPIFEYSIEQKRKKTKLRYRWKADITNFNMPLLVGEKDNYIQIYPTTEWQSITLEEVDDFVVAEELFLVEVKEIK